MGNTWESGIDINAEHTSKVLQSEIEAEHRKTFGFLQIGLISLTFQKVTFSARGQEEIKPQLLRHSRLLCCEASADSGSSDGVCTHRHHLACTISITHTVLLISSQDCPQHSVLFWFTGSSPPSIKNI